MNIEAEKFKLEMTYDELWSTACDVKNALEYTLKTHWVRHQDSWMDHEASRMYRLKTFFNALGRQDMYEDISRKAEEIFAEHNKLHKALKTNQ